MTTALIVIDFINDMVGESGKLTGKGYGTFAQEHNTAAALEGWRAKDDMLTILVGLQFREGYPELPAKSILLGKVQDFGVAPENGEGSEFVVWAAPRAGDVVLRKRRISAFYGTDLETVLRSNGVENVVIGGVATDLAVSSAVRDAHDRDFRVVVATDICVAASDTDHEAALTHLAKISELHSWQSF